MRPSSRLSLLRHVRQQYSKEKAEHSLGGVHSHNSAKLFPLVALHLSVWVCAFLPVVLKGPSSFVSCSFRLLQASFLHFLSGSCHVLHAHALVSLAWKVARVQDTK